MGTNTQSTNNQKLGVGNWALEIGVGHWIIDCIETFTDFPAVVIQHEMDHLNGKIFVEKILEQKGSLYKITGKDKNGKEEWEEVEL